MENGYIKATNAAYHLLIEEGVEDTYNLLSTLDKRDWITFVENKMSVVTDGTDSFQRNTLLTPYTLQDNKLMIDINANYRLTVQDIEDFKIHFLDEECIETWDKWEDKKAMFTEDYFEVLSEIKKFKKFKSNLKDMILEMNISKTVH